MSKMNGSAKLVFPLVFVAFSLLSIPALAREKTFSTLDDPKAKGVVMSFKYPDYWELRESSRPNVVVNMRDLSNPAFPAGTVLLIKEFPAELSVSDQQEMLAPDRLRDFVPAGSAVVSENYGTLDGERAGILELVGIQKPAGLEIATHSLLYLVVHKGRLMNLSFSVGGPGHEKLKVSQQFEKMRPTFLRVAMSVVFAEKWKSQIASGVPSQEAQASGNVPSVNRQTVEGFEQSLWLAFLPGLLLLFLLGAALPAVTRFALFRRPLTGRVSLAFAVVFSFSSLLLGIVLRGPNHHGGSSMSFLFVFFLSRAILKSGAVNPLYKRD
ncbi:MAG: hypothetical protein EOP05_01985 [Proteobacteria bacterium]|nr:MAG: hypothetical protein EOP05_01985 [Pseudomonadota bacterium]